MLRLRSAAGMVEDYILASYIPQSDENDLFWGAHVLAVVSFAEAMRVQLGFAYGEADHESAKLLNEGDAIATTGRQAHLSCGIQSIS
jgi:hypothetical protein